MADPDLETFRHLVNRQPVVPVVRRLLADTETAVGLYRRLAGNRPGTFLLESAEHGGIWSRYSFVGVHCAGALTERDGTTQWLGRGLPTRSDDPLQALGEAVRMLRSPRREDLPPLTGGLVGYVGYDAVRRLERLPSTAPDELGMPELAMLLATDVAVLDHSNGTVVLIANHVRGLSGASDADDPVGAYENCLDRLDAMTEQLAAPLAPGVAALERLPAPVVESRTGSADYRTGVEAIREHIRAGDAFQVVLSQRFSVPTDVDGLDLYRALRTTNPSPYMYLLRFAGRESPYDVVGSSPEALVKVTGDHALLHPIAGTRPRGETPEADARLAEDLLADPKERSEHVMLVDLGRNDLGRVCRPGSVEVLDFMAVERYSHVMHIVSTVVGELAEGRDSFDALSATFPAGTLSGAPKPRAMEIIEALEPVRRNLYGGVVGYIDATGDLDTAIAIRTAVLHGGVAHVQAGAGIVADSDAAAEDRECHAKAAAVLQAVAMAAALRPEP